MASRTENSIRNVFAAWGGQALLAVSQFVVRAVFVASLAQEYVGLETLFASVLTVLTLADLGVGSAIVFALYEPLAKGDREAIKSLMRLFKRAYIAIGCTIIAIGLAVTPFIRFLLGDDAPDIPYLEVYFFCFVLNTGISYFFSYKGSLIMADQKSYVVYLYQYSFSCVMAVFQVAVLLLTHNYLLFLVCMVGSTFLQNVCIAIKANKMYPYILEKDVQPINREVLDGIKKNVLGLIMHKVAGVASTPVSNIVITKFVGLATTSIYGNYLLVVNALTSITSRLFDSIIASVGNLKESESEERAYEIFKATLFINAFLYAVVCGGLLCSFNAFIAIWVGDDWQFPPVIVVLIVLLFYVKGMRNAGLTFTSAYGLYWYTRWKAVLEAVSLPALALILVKPLGIAGVLLAGVASSVCIATLYEAWAVYRHGFHRPLRRFVVAYLKYTTVTFTSVALAYFVCFFIPLEGVLAFFIFGFIGVFIPGVAYVALFGRTPEFRELSVRAKSIFGRIAGKMKKGAREK